MSIQYDADASRRASLLVGYIGGYAPSSRLAGRAPRRHPGHSVSGESLSHRARYYGFPRAEARGVRLQRRVTMGCKSAPARALGSETEGNCVAARRGGEQLEVNRRSATQVNSIRLVHVASLLPRGEAQTARKSVAPRAQRRRRDMHGCLGAERREDDAREAGRPGAGQPQGDGEAARSQSPHTSGEAA